jgi:acyl-coenzyme A synthetase/AMP-(fatty) acid ligase
VGGRKVAPVEVEQSILELDFVRDTVVSGEPHSLMGQVVTARVVLVTGAMDPKDAVKRIRMHCRRHLASYKVPIRVDIVAQGFSDDRQKVQRRRTSD